MTNKGLLLSGIVFFLYSLAHAQEPDTLPPLQDGKVPQNLTELWAGFDPQKEPLDTEVLKEWEADGNVYRIVRFRVGVFKGKKSMLEAIYGFPKGATKLPALLQIHGGGQHAELAVCRMDAGRGYASLSINWGGNPLGLGQTTFDGPNTDWGALDATHPPQRNKNNHYIEGAGLEPDEYTIDSVKSPRNSNWFVVLMGARRAITFLQQQPEVDPDRIGVYGHSMGGKLTTDLAGIDPRIKAAAPSCGGAGDIDVSQTDLAGCVKNAIDPMELNCNTDNAYLANGIKCPILLNVPSNDFNTPFDNIFYNWRNLPDATTRFSVTPHMNHRQIPECAITRYLWMDQNLKHGFTMPKTPQLLVDLKTPDGVPTATVTPDPDTAQPLQKVDIYYSIDPHVLSRFWRHVDAVQNGATWQAPLPILSTDQPLFVFANVTYPLPDFYQASEKIKDYTFSSREVSETADALKAAGVKATDTLSTLIDDGTRDWQDWYRLEWFNAPFWACYTRKLKDPKWQGPDGAHLVFDVLSSEPNSFVITVFTNEWGAFPGKPTGSYSVRKQLDGSSWQTVSLSVGDFIPTADNPNGKLPPLANWQTVTQLCFSQNEQTGKRAQPGTVWQGAPFAFRNLHWEGGTVTANPLAPDAALSSEALQKGFNDGIKKSLEQERVDQTANPPQK